MKASVADGALRMEERPYVSKVLTAEIIGVFPNSWCEGVTGCGSDPSHTCGAAMDNQQIVLKGFAVRRRCDACGRRIDVVADDGEKCTLRCAQCGKEYNFYFKGS